MTLRLAGRVAAAAFCALAWAPAWAQLSASAGLVSDYRVRGVSLSGERPAPQLTLNLDTAGGWYAGLLASRAQLRYTGVDAQAVVYAGYARRIDAELSWEAGVTRNLFRGGADYDYGEVYAGLSAQRLAGRVYYSANYLGTGKPTVYAELNGNQPLTGSLDLIAHLGYLHPLPNEVLRQYPSVRRYDGRLGAGLALEAWTVQLAWTGFWHDSAPNPAYWNDHERTVVLSVARAF